MRSSSFVTILSLACAASLAVAVGCKTSSSNMNGSSSTEADGGMNGMSADGGMGGMSSDGGMGSMSGSMSGAQSSMNSGMNSASGSMNSMADAGTNSMNNGMNNAQSGMNSGMNSASSSMNNGATTAADAARNASGSMGMDNDGGMSGSSGSMGSSGSSGSSGSMGSSSSSGSSGSSASSGSSGSSGSASSGNLDDGQIAGITAAAHKGEIDAAKLARKQSKNAKVKSFAQMMLKQHTMALKTEKSLESKAGITAADSDQSQQITQQNSETASKLQGLHGKDFDQAYVQAMVDGHQKVLDTIDNTLIPAAQNPQLKAQLQKERTVVETHLDHAKKLNDSLGGGSQ